MNKETVLKDLAMKLKVIEAQMASVNKIELNTVYKYKETIYCTKPMIIAETVDSYGYFECFNRESARFIILASNNPDYSDSKWRNHRGYTKALNYVFVSKTTWKGSAVIDLSVTSLASKLTAVKEKDLPLLVGMKYSSPELEKVFKGKKKLKYA
jgi:hypothetical protein